MVKPILYRKRVIPNECIRLDNDIILHYDSSTIITSWDAFHKKSFLSYGYSLYYLDKGIKLSKFYKEDNTFSLWYFDIVSYEKNSDTNTLTVHDLLADVIVYPDGRIKVVDLDELASAVKDGLINSTDLQTCLNTLDMLLKELYEHGISRLIPPLEDAITSKTHSNS